jgi:hypothetical protein
MKNKIQKLEGKFESVTLQFEKLEVSRDFFIELEISTSKNYDCKINSIQNKIYDLECKQYGLQKKIEEFQLCS